MSISKQRTDQKPDWLYQLPGMKEPNFFHFTNDQKNQLLTLMKESSLQFKYQVDDFDHSRFIGEIESLIHMYIVQMEGANSHPTVKQQENARDLLVEQIKEISEKLSGGVSGIKLDLLTELGDKDSNGYLRLGNIDNYILESERISKALKNISPTLNKRSAAKSAKTRMANVLAHIFNMYFTESPKTTCELDLENYGGYASMLKWCLLVSAYPEGNLNDYVLKGIKSLR